MKAVFLSIVLCLFADAAFAEPQGELLEFSDDANRGLAAYQAGDWSAAESDFAAATQHAPQRAIAYYYIAASAAHRGETAKAFAALDRFADFGTGTTLDADNAFAGLKDSAEYVRIREKFARNTAPRCNCQTMFEGSNAPFIAEGIAYDSTFDRLFVASVQSRRIVTIQNGHVQDFAALPNGLSPLGIRINPAHDLLWVAAATLPQSKGASAQEQGQSALLAFALSGGALRNIYEAPDSADGKRSFNDIAIAQDGTIYVSDAIEGSIFRVRPGANALERVGSAAPLKSPQGMVVSRDAETLLVADYAAGLLTVDASTGETQQVAVPDGVTTVTMDGLIQLPDGSFAATQNGIHPARLVHFRLTHNWAAMTSFSVIAQGPQLPAPSLLTRDGGDIVTIGTSQWPSFGDSPVPARPLSNWRILRTPIP